MDNSLKIKSPPEHNFQLIAVPGELLTKPLSNYKYLYDEKYKYRIIEWIPFEKGMAISSSVKFLAIGQEISDKRIWNTYDRSKRIVFFITERYEL